MARYVDGFVVPVPRARLDEYRALARLASEIWMENGALEYVECVADDVQPGKHTSFPQAVDLKDDEVVVFSWIAYPSRAERDRINEASMNDERLKDLDMDTAPFDAQRMFWGGFEELVRA